MTYAAVSVSLLDRGTGVIQVMYGYPAIRVELVRQDTVVQAVYVVGDDGAWTEV